MIPKITHQLWLTENDFKYPQYRGTIKDFNPGYEHKFWTLQDLLQEDLLPLSRTILYDPEIFFLVKTEVARHEVLRLYGGIYLDTDMEALKNFDPLLNCSSFIGLEDEKNLGTSIIGLEKGSPMPLAYLTWCNAQILRYKKMCNMRPVKMVGPRCRTFQDIYWRCSMRYPSTFFYPFNITELENRNLTFERAYTKHHWTCKEKGGWIDKQREFLCPSK